MLPLDIDNFTGFPRFTSSSQTNKPRFVGIHYAVPNNFCIFPSGLFCNIQAALINMCESTDFDISMQFSRITVPSQCELLITLADDNLSMRLMMMYNNEKDNGESWKISKGQPFLQSARKLIEELIVQECPGLLKEDYPDSVRFLCPDCINEKYFQNGSRGCPFFPNKDITMLLKTNGNIKC